MSENKKPRLAEVLGVEVEEKFYIRGYYYNPYFVNNEGVLIDGRCFAVDPVLSGMINHPELIKRCPRWTEQEVEDAKAILKIIADAVYIERLRATTRLCILDAGNSTIAFVNSELFPSINNGEIVALDDIIGGNE